MTQRTAVRYKVMECTGCTGQTNVPLKDVYLCRKCAYTLFKQAARELFLILFVVYTAADLLGSYLK